MNFQIPPFSYIRSVVHLLHLISLLFPLPVVMVQFGQFVPYTRNDESIILWMKGGNTVKMSESALLKSGLNRAELQKLKNKCKVD